MSVSNTYHISKATPGIHILFDFQFNHISFSIEYKTSKETCTSTLVTYWHQRNNQDLYYNCFLNIFLRDKKKRKACINTASLNICSPKLM